LRVFQNLGKKWTVYGCTPQAPPGAFLARNVLGHTNPNWFGTYFLACGAQRWDWPHFVPTMFLIEKTVFFVLPFQFAVHAAQPRAPRTHAKTHILTHVNVHMLS